VKVEDLLEYWQNIGVEASNEQEIENVIHKVTEIILLHNVYDLHNFHQI